MGCSSSVNLNICLFVLLYAIFFLSSPMLSDDKEDSVLQGINSYRTSLQLPSLVKNKKASCLADEIADKLEDQPCTHSSTVQLSGYPDLLDKCGIDVNHTTDGAVLPVCVPKLVPTLVLTNFTHNPQYAKFLNDSKYTGAGMGSEDDWMVMVLSTNSPTGTFAAGNRLVSSGVGFGSLAVAGMIVFLLMY
ncbi:Glycoprotein membrane precursor GPI-anchored [Euphorbia peplus]|nr:Glycoprotein membrane precursor GPI-anchored [Euphorbia peplus]